MYLRKVREGKGAKKTNMEPVWITCDDLNTEGILVRCSSCMTITAAGRRLLFMIRIIASGHDQVLRCKIWITPHSDWQWTVRLASDSATNVGTLLASGMRLSCRRLRS